MGFVDHTILMFRKIVYSHLPFTYKHLSQERMHKTTFYIMFLIALSLVLMCAASIPQLMGLPGFFQEQLGKFETFKLDGEVKQSDPIYFPEDNPQIVIDASGKEPYGNELFMLTSDYLYFHLTSKPKRVKVSNLLAPLSHESEISKIILAVILFLAPSVLFFTYFFLLLKYALIIGISSVLLFSIVRVMLLIKISFRRTFNIAAYAATPMILVEIISIPFNPKYLFPLFRYFGLTLYATTTLVYLIFLVSGFLLVEDGVVQGFVEEDSKDEPLPRIGGK